MNYLMITLRDKRKFLTNTKHLNQLVEFAKTFGANISIVTTECKNLLSLDKLAEDICDTNSKPNEFTCEIVQSIPVSQSKTNIVFKKIINALRRHRHVDTEEIVSLYKKKGIDEKNIYSQITRAKKHITKIGMTLKKLGRTKFTAI
jgi:hypothetical protein